MYRDPRGTGTRRYEPPSPSYCSDDEKEREAYFLDNPDFEFDELPQPFRFLDKILEEILDQLSVEIGRVEKLKQLKSQTKPLPIFKNPSMLDLSNAQEKITQDLKYDGVTSTQGCILESFKVSTTTNTIFVARERQLQAISIFTRKCLAQTEVGSAAPLYMLIAMPVGISDKGNAIDVALLTDKSGYCYSFLFDGKELFPVKLFEGGKTDPAHVLKWKFCDDLGLLSITKKQPSTGHVIEIYKIPKEQWIHEYENAMKKLQNNEDKFGDQDLLVANESSEVKLSSAHSFEEDDETESHSQHKLSHLMSNLQLTCMNLIATLKPPKEVSSLASNSTTKIPDGAKLGSGDKNWLNSAFYETLKLQLKADLLGLSANVDEDIDLNGAESIPNIHFLKRVNVRLTTENNPDQKQCLHDMIGIWWSSRNQFFIYKLPKSSRDGEVQLDQVYTNADLIAGSCVNEDTSLIAIALNNNNIIVWNRLTSKPSKVIQLDEPDLLCMKFAQVEDGSELLIFGMNSGIILQLNYGTSDLNLKPLTDQSSVKQSKLLRCELVPKHPSLLFVARDPDLITVFDLNQQSAIFHFQLPSGFTLDCSSSPCFMFNRSLSMLLVFARKQMQYDYPIHGVFIYNMCIGEPFPELLPDRVSTGLKKVDVNGPQSLETIALKLMGSIHEQKLARKERQQKRWKEYERELKKRI